VYFFEGSGKPYLVSTYDITDATFTDAKIWAKGKQVPAGIQLHSFHPTNVETAGSPG
jgi:hypothetical protein